MATTRVNPDDDRYDPIKEEWVENGSPFQFNYEEEGWGGAIVQARTIDNVTYFWITASQKPTEIDNEGEVTVGWPFMNLESGYQKLWFDKESRIKTEIKPYPNELEK
jgi:hypothetical protein